MTNDEINNYHSLCKAATRGPWMVDVILASDADPDCGSDEVISRGLRSEYSGLNKGLEYEMFSEADAEFIAAARTALPDALDEIERLWVNKEQAETVIDSQSEIMEDLRSRVAELEGYKKLMPFTADGVRWDGEFIPWFINPEGRPKQARQVVRTRDQWVVYQGEIKGVWTVVYFRESYSTEEAAMEAVTN